MGAPNFFLNYVSDAAASARFYGQLFDMEPVFTSPRYIAFEIAEGVIFAVWSGADDVVPVPNGEPRSEVGLSLPGGADEIDALFATWQGKGVTVVSKPHDAVFGRTFVVADPDGNLIRVATVD